MALHRLIVVRYLGAFAAATVLTLGILQAIPSDAKPTPVNPVLKKLTPSHDATPRSTAAAVTSPGNSTAKRTIDIVFAIDCSGSMGGVIETAKQKVWSIVNEVAKAKPSPALRIGLLGYGNADVTFRRFDLTNDLDEVYKNLMTFKDEGWSEEYVGLVIEKSLKNMSWSSGNKGLKIVYVVGNETAKQGPVDYLQSAPVAIKHGVVVNAIYCGSSSGEETWQEFSRLAEGQFLHIAGDGGSILIPTPYDAELQKLGESINRTYLGYGARAAYGMANQNAQDIASADVGGSANAAERAVAKSSAQYNNSTWDLVDASREPDFDLSKIKKEELPADMQKMTLPQRKAHLAKKAQERAQIQEKIKTLSAKRAKYIEQKMKTEGRNPDKSFDEAVRRSLVQQGAKKGFSFTR